MQYFYKEGCAGGAKPPPVLVGIMRSVCSLPLRVFASVSLTHPAGGLSWAFPRHSPCPASAAYKGTSSLAYPPFVATGLLNSSKSEVQPALPPEKGRISPKEKNMFSSCVCPGDSVMFEHGKFTFNVSLEYDDISTPYEWECYSDSDIRKWKNDEWYYGGLVVSVSYNGVHLSDNIASLWGLECNFGEDNSYLMIQAEELVKEAGDEAKKLLESVRSRLAA